MMPGDLSGPELAKSLRAFGCEITRQTGSHLRLTTQQRGEHHVTIPNHFPVKIGTPSGILNDVSQHLDISREELLNCLTRK